MKRHVVSALGGYAKRLIRREKPFIVGVTGSVGKSSAKQAVAAVLKDTFRVRATPKNYNTDIGVPLAVLGVPNGGSSSVAWLSTLLTGAWRAAFGVKRYPDTLVLEMAADHPGDIRRLADIAPPDIAVVTGVGEAHLEFFGSVDDIEKEKRTLVEALGERGVAVLNADDDRVMRMRAAAKGKVMTYGFGEDADVRATGLVMRCELGEQAKCGLGFTLMHGGASVQATLSGVLGAHSVYAALAAAAVGIARGIALQDAAARFHAYEPPAGRMRCLTGIKRTLIIDDTYNSSPKAAHAALEALKECVHTSPAPDDVKIAVLGDMLELGADAPRLHEEIGRAVVDAGVDVFVAVGELMGDAAKAAVAYGMPQDRVVHFGRTEDAGRYVQGRMKQGDIVLVKGSQGMRMERVVKELMADPLHAKDLLCRQDDSWDA